MKIVPIFVALLALLIINDKCFQHYPLNKVVTITGHYPEILGRRHFKGIGKNISRSWLSRHVKWVPNGGVREVLKLHGKIQEQNIWLGPGTKPQLS